MIKDAVDTIVLCILTQSCHKFPNNNLLTSRIQGTLCCIGNTYTHSVEGCLYEPSFSNVV